MRLTVSALVLSFIVSAQAANAITPIPVPSGIPGSASLSSLFSSESSVQQSIFSSESSVEKSILSSHSSIARSIVSANPSCVHSALSSLYTHTPSSHSTFSSFHTHSIPSSLVTSLPCTFHHTASASPSGTTPGASSSGITSAGNAEATTSSAAGRTEAGIGLTAGAAAGLLAFLFY